MLQNLIFYKNCKNSRKINLIMQISLIFIKNITKYSHLLYDFFYYKILNLKVKNPFSFTLQNLKLHYMLNLVDYFIYRFEFNVFLNYPM